ncbi:MAG: putative addiction module component, family [Myxococcaceae bacterium]|nr:putative addiction module component, family [Myxococcaceae bacterium]
MDAALLKVIASLPRDEQLDLVEAVWDGLVANDEAPTVTDAQRRVLDQRLDAMAREPDATLSWDEVRARVRGPR